MTYYVMTNEVISSYQQLNNLLPANNNSPEFHKLSEDNSIKQKTLFKGVSKDDVNITNTSKIAIQENTIFLLILINWKVILNLSFRGKEKNYVNSSVYYKLHHFD